jgi:hypothetical protein
MNGFWNAATVISDGPPAGYGIFQLTVPPVGYQGNWPIDNWQDPDTNTEFALVNYLIPDMRIWVSKFGLTGDSLVKCTAASFNAGLSAAESGHEQGNVDLYDTDAYGMTVLKIYKQIAATGNPGTLN